MAYGYLKVGAAGVVGVALTVTGASAVLFAAGGCGNDAAGANAKLPEGTRSIVIIHEPCDEAGNKVESLDATNNGKADIKRVMKNGKEICRITDLNHDGKPDMFEYYDASGQLRRREADYDDNNVVNSIVYFENGKLARRELDTTNQGRIDTWDFFDPDSGKRTRRERDTTGDGKIDQWWTYDGTNVTIAMDRNGDGLPDPDSTITLGANGQAIIDAGASASNTPAPSASASSTPVAAPTPPTISMPSPNGDPAPPVTPPSQDAGVAGKPQRGGAKR